MFWTILSVSACIALIVKLVLFSDEHRQASRWAWRLVLFLVVVYAAQRTITILYAPHFEAHPLRAMLHVALFIGSLVMRPEYLPWNGTHDSQDSIAYRLGRLAGRIVGRLWGAQLHGAQRDPGNPTG